MVTDFPASTLDIMPTIVDLLDLSEDSMLAAHDGESILPLFEGGTPERTHPIPFTMKGTALIDGRFKLLKDGKGKGATWALFDLKVGYHSAEGHCSPNRDRLVAGFPVLLRARVAVLVQVAATPVRARD